MLKDRLLFGAMLIAGLVGLIYLDNRLSGAGVADHAPAWLAHLGLHSFHGVPTTVVLAVLVILGTWELLRLFSAAGHRPLRAWPVVVNVGLVLIAFHAGNGPHAEELAGLAADHGRTVAWLTVGLLGTACLIARRRTTSSAIGNMATTLFVILYLGLLPQYLIRLRLAAPDGGAWLLLYVVGTIKVCDIGAYFTGRAVGRHKLIPWLSPGKTIEGLAGGVVSSMLVAAMVPLLVGTFAQPASPVAALLPTPGKALIFGLLMALCGQAGDLLESLIKRDAQAKDSAKAIPAFGGVLDLLDSVLLAAPIAYAMLVK